MMSAWLQSDKGTGPFCCLSRMGQGDSFRVGTPTLPRMAPSDDMTLPVNDHTANRRVGPCGAKTPLCQRQRHLHMVNIGFQDTIR